MKHRILLGFFIFTLHLCAQQSDFSNIDFAKAEHFAIMLEGEDLINLPILTYKLTAHLDTDVEKFRAIYFWVTHNIEGDYDLTRTNDKKRARFQENLLALEDWNHQFKAEIFKRLVEDKQTLCTGYAYLVQKLAKLAGLECKIINGFDLTNTKKSKEGTLPNHSWNAIKLNEKWYLCDATWSSGFTDMSTFLFEFEYDDSFFLMEPSEFGKTHLPTEEKWTLTDQDLNN